MSSRRSRILAAAVDLFAQQDFDGTSFGAVASATEVKKFLVQYHFDSKERLWQESIRYVWKLRGEALPRYLQESSPTDGQDREQMVRELCRIILHSRLTTPNG